MFSSHIVTILLNRAILDMNKAVFIMLTLLSVFPFNINPKDWMPAALCFVLSFVFLAILNFSPSKETELAVIFPFGTMPDDSFLKTIKSGAYATGKGMFGNIVLFRTEEDNLQDVIDNLYNEGALAVINGLESGGCFKNSP